MLLTVELCPSSDSPSGMDREKERSTGARAGAGGCCAAELSRAQSGVVPGWEAQETCLIGPGGRLYHIRELGPGRAGTSLSGLPQPGRDAPRCQHWGPKTLFLWGFRSPAGVCCLWRHPWHCIVSFRYF